MPYHHLTPVERGQIQALFSVGTSISEIGQMLGRHRSTVWRELKRNSLHGTYDFQRAQNRYVARRQECRPERKLNYEPLWRHTMKKLACHWSPQQIAGRLPLDFPSNPRMRISHEALYQAIYNDERLSPFIGYLRQARPKRRKRGQGKNTRCIIPNRISIKERPTTVEDRSQFGHWEGDLVLGANQQGAVLSLVGRKSKMLLARKVQTKQSEEVIAAAIHAFEDLPASWVKSVTFDNGTEFYHHRRLQEELGVATYFADAYTAYQRGTNENTNGLLRQYLPKGMSLKNLTQQQLDDIVNEINNRPRKTIGYLKPCEVFEAFKKNKPIALKA